VAYSGGITGTRLVGTLSLPAGDGPFPAALLISGSGPQDRDETVFYHRPFRILADHLVRRGIAVLRVDDRGFGASTGDFAPATTEDFVDDALSGFAFIVLLAGPGVSGADVLTLQAGSHLK
jgi:predicted acyl esterase